MDQGQFELVKEKLQFDNSDGSFTVIIKLVCWICAGRMWSNPLLYGVASWGIWGMTNREGSLRILTAMILQQWVRSKATIFSFWKWQQRWLLSHRFLVTAFGRLGHSFVHQCSCGSWMLEGSVRGDGRQVWPVPSENTQKGDQGVPKFDCQQIWLTWSVRCFSVSTSNFLIILEVWTMRNYSELLLSYFQWVRVGLRFQFFFGPGLGKQPSWSGTSNDYALLYHNHEVQRVEVGWKFLWKHNFSKLMYLLRNPKMMLIKKCIHQAIEQGDVKV